MDCTLDIYTDYLISSTGQTTATGLSALHAGALSHDKVTRFLTGTHLDSRELWGCNSNLRFGRSEQVDDGGKWVWPRKLLNASRKSRWSSTTTKLIFIG